MGAKLTARQRYALERAAKGGILGFGHSKITIWILQRNGLLSSEKDAAGYYNITEAGRRALTEEQR